MNDETCSVIPSASAASVVSAAAPRTLLHDEGAVAPGPGQHPEEPPVTSFGSKVTPSWPGTTCGLPPTILNDASWGPAAIACILGASVASSAGAVELRLELGADRLHGQRGGEVLGLEPDALAGEADHHRAGHRRVGEPVHRAAHRGLADGAGRDSVVGSSTAVAPAVGEERLRTTVAAAARSTTVPFSG